METRNYKDSQGQVDWHGVSLSAGDEFSSFMVDEVAARVNDEEGKDAYESHLKSLVGTGFDAGNLSQILDADVEEERDWAIGEALAEAWLTREHGVVWPWNMERDKRTPKASLPGADLIGFVLDSGKVKLAVGEVKSSSQAIYPPNVMSGRHGMINQLDNLATNLGLLTKVIQWLFFRCKSTEFEDQFNQSILLFIKSGNKAVQLFGVLIRDVDPDEQDLLNRGKALSKIVANPTSCDLYAIYLPCEICGLPDLIQGGALS